MSSKDVLWTRIGRQNLMARSKGVIISVKIPINWGEMTDRAKRRLRQTVGRDTRVIRAYLGVIEQHEEMLLRGRNKDRIHEGRLDLLTMTTQRIKPGNQQRMEVPHDFKVKFPRISTNEMQECRVTAVAAYESYLKLRTKRGRYASRPTGTNATRRIPRWVYSQRFKIVEKETSTARWWVDIRDSLDSAHSQQRDHDRLTIPLKMSPFHLNQINRGDVRALQIFTDRNHKWWVTLAVRMNISDSSVEARPVAVLGIDLGIEKAVCTALLTPEKTRETRFFLQKEKVLLIRKYDSLVANLQTKMDTRKNNGAGYDAIAVKLSHLRTKRENISREYDRVLVHQLLEYISNLSEKYRLYVAIGRLKNIRVRARKGNYRGRRFRRMIHSWAFSRITNNLQHGLAQLGWEVNGKKARFRAIPEAWTSILCWKCGNKGMRPKQSYFYCPSCGHKTNADRNGAINIAARFITLTSSLHDVRGLGKWDSAIAKAKTRISRPKAQMKKSSLGRSLLSKKEQSSGSGESAVVHHAQSSILSFSDGAVKGDDDPAVVRTVETLTVTGSDCPAQKQEKEARFVGGIPSQ